MASFSEWKKKQKAGQQTAVKDTKEWGPSVSKSDMAFSDWVNRKKDTAITPYKSQGTTAAVKPISDITGEASGYSGSFGGTRAGSFTGSRGSGPFGGGSKYEALPSTKRRDEKEELRSEVRQQTQLAKGVSPETLGERAKQQEWTETVESDRREAGQLGAKVRLGEATDQDVTDYLGKIKENYGLTQR